jgi:predicted nuclease of predicted toxin-antitoxin system
VRILADSNIVARAVRDMRQAGHDVVYAGERAKDPGDEALLAEAAAETRVFITKDHDIGALVHRDEHPHSGVLLLDDLGDAAAEAELILFVLSTHQVQLSGGVFLRAGSDVREARASSDSPAQ